MREKLYYLDINGQYHFIHEHKSFEVKGLPFIFLNPVFDEKKRSQQFYAETAREFCKKGIPVIRFDYYGTGDSEGQLFEMDFHNILNVVSKLIKDVFNEYKIQKVNLLGLRIGADLAIKIAGDYSDYVSDLILIEPVIIGKRYLTEQRSRRKMFYKINGMKDIQEEITINDTMYEDHQGYPISFENLQFLNDLDSTKTHLTQKDIWLVKLNTISSRKTMGQLKEKLAESNQVTIESYICDDFWANLEPIDTKGLSERVTNYKLQGELFSS